MQSRMAIKALAICLCLLTFTATAATAQTRRINPHQVRRSNPLPTQTVEPRPDDAELPAPELPSAVAKAMGLIDGTSEPRLAQATEPITETLSLAASSPAATVETNSPLTSIATGSGIGTGVSTPTAASAAPQMANMDGSIVGPEMAFDSNFGPTCGIPGGPTCGIAGGPTCGAAGGPMFGGNCGSHGSGINFLPGMSIDHLSLFGGVQGFKNNSNRGADGSFGFHEGVNFGTSARNVVFPPSIGFQLGFQATQTNLDGASFTLQERNQTFLTTGIFRRGDYGLQGGIVFDYLWDDWYYDLNVGQIRGEISMAVSERTSYGFRVRIADG